jgi:hypothetical protein
MLPAPRLPSRWRTAWCSLAPAAALAGAVLAPGRAASAEPGPPPPPPARNVHLVLQAGPHCCWRGAAPRRETLVALAASARRRNVRVTLIDLRRPATADDRSGKDRRLSPAQEAALARRLGLEYRSLSALDGALIPELQAALARGDVYLHCMYGVNRTGFATARFAVAMGLAPTREGLGPRDWRQGEAHERRRRLSARRAPAP